MMLILMINSMTSKQSAANILTITLQNNNPRHIQTNQITINRYLPVVHINRLRNQFIKSQNLTLQLQFNFYQNQILYYFFYQFSEGNSQLMGNSSTLGQSHDQFDPSHWLRNQKIRHLFVLSHKNNPQFEIQKYPVSIAEDRDYSAVKEMFLIRKNDPDFIATLFFDISHNEELCSKNYHGYVFTERIPLRLSDLMDIPFPDVLHVYNQTLNGFQRLSKMFRPFKIIEQCIGVNSKNIVKVWHGPHFQTIEPSSQNCTEIDMVRNIITIIEEATNPLSMPTQEPSFSKFVYRQSQWVGFGEAKRKLEKYTNLYNDGIMPNYLRCVADVGGASQILGKCMQPIYPGFSHTSQGLNPISQPSFHQKVSSIKPPISNGPISKNLVPITHIDQSHPLKPRILQNTQNNFLHRQQTRTISQPSPIPSYQTPTTFNPTNHNNFHFNTKSRNHLTRSFVVSQPAIKPNSFYHKPYSSNFNINKSNSSSNIHKFPQYDQRVNTGFTININNKCVQNGNIMNNQKKFERGISKPDNEDSIATFRRPLNFAQNYEELRKGSQSTPVIKFESNNFTKFPNPQKNIQQVPIPAKLSSKKSSPKVHKEQQQNKQHLLINQVKSQNIKRIDDKLTKQKINIEDQRHPVGANFTQQIPSFDFQPKPALQNHNISEVDQFRINTSNQNSQPEGVSPKFSEINPSISSIGLGQIKSGYQDSSMEDTTKNLYNNLKMSEQLESDYGYTKNFSTPYDYGISSKINKKTFDTGYSDSNFMQTLKISHKNQSSNPPKVYEDYSYLGIGQTHKESEIGNKGRLYNYQQTFQKQDKLNQRNKLISGDLQLQKIAQSPKYEQKQRQYQYKHISYQPYQNQNNMGYNYQSNIEINGGADLYGFNSNFDTKNKNNDKQWTNSVCTPNYELNNYNDHKNNVYTPYTTNNPHHLTDQITDKQKHKKYQSSIHFQDQPTSNFQKDEYQFKWDPQIWADLKKLSADQ